MVWGWLVSMATSDTVLCPAAKFAFNQLDTDGSGEISAGEVHKTLEYLASYVNVSLTPTEEQIQIAIKVCDKDANGKINLEEFIEFVRKLAGTVQA